MPLLLIVGPTASGKTNLAIEVAERLNGEIICADSMQIYRRCDIVTAKPTPEERARVPHHLIDVCEPTEQFSAAQWAEAARQIIVQIKARERVPIVVGGTGFYLRALLQPEVLSSVPPDEALRAQLQRDLEIDGAKSLWQRLQTADSAAAARLHPNDSFRVMRALEVAQNAPQIAASNLTSEFEFQAFALNWPRPLLYQRIEARIDAMIALGAWDELRGLISSGVPRDAPALNGVGYKQLLPALNNASLEQECIETWKRDTRRYAKRQMTWFRHQLRVQWIDIDQSTLMADVAQKILNNTVQSTSREEVN